MEATGDPVSGELDALITGAVHDPHALLGAHPADEGTVVRTLRRRAREVSVIVGSRPHPARRVHDEGVFEAAVPGLVSDYRVNVDGQTVDDPYRHQPTLGEFDLQLIG